MMVLAVILAGFLWMVRYRFPARFMRGYMLFYTVLLVMVVNKGNKDTVNEFQGDNLGPLSLARWAVLALLVLLALRIKVPPTFKTDALLGMMVLLFVIDSLLSSTYSEDFTYSFPRAAGFAMLGVGLLRGLSFYLHNNENSVGFFRFHYYIGMAGGVAGTCLPFRRVRQLWCLDGHGEICRRVRQPEHARSLLSACSALRSASLAGGSKDTATTLA